MRPFPARSLLSLAQCSALLLAAAGCCVSPETKLQRQTLLTVVPTRTALDPRCPAAYCVSPEFFGHNPTCWRRWPGDWVGCPPCDPEGMIITEHSPSPPAESSLSDAPVEAAEAPAPAPVQPAPAVPPPPAPAPNAAPAPAANPASATPVPPAPAPAAPPGDASYPTRRRSAELVQRPEFGPSMPTGPLPVAIEEESLGTPSNYVPEATSAESSPPEVAPTERTVASAQAELSPVQEVMPPADFQPQLLTVEPEVAAEPTPAEPVLVQENSPPSDPQPVPSQINFRVLPEAPAETSPPVAEAPGYPVEEPLLPSLPATDSQSTEESSIAVPVREPAVPAVSARIEFESSAADDGAMVPNRSAEDTVEELASSLQATAPPATTAAEFVPAAPTGEVIAESNLQESAPHKERIEFPSLAEQPTGRSWPAHQEVVSEPVNPELAIRDVPDMEVMEEVVVPDPILTPLPVQLRARLLTVANPQTNTRPVSEKIRFDAEEERESVQESEPVRAPEFPAFQPNLVSEHIRFEAAEPVVLAEESADSPQSEDELVVVPTISESIRFDVRDPVVPVAEAEERTPSLDRTEGAGLPQWKPETARIDFPTDASADVPETAETEEEMIVPDPDLMAEESEMVIADPSADEAAETVTPIRLQEVEVAPAPRMPVEFHREPSALATSPLGPGTNLKPAVVAPEEVPAPAEPSRPVIAEPMRVDPLLSKVPASGDLAPKPPLPYATNKLLPKSIPTLPKSPAASHINFGRSALAPAPGKRPVPATVPQKSNAPSRDATRRPRTGSWGN